MLFYSYFKTLVGKQITVELKNDLAIVGTLHSVDQVRVRACGARGRVRCARFSRVRHPTWRLPPLARRTRPAVRSR